MLIALQRPSFLIPSALLSVIQVVMGSLFVALCTQISIPLPFSPIPVTGQTFAILCLAIALGPKKGFFSLLLYLAEGAIGLPFFAQGACGLSVLCGVRFGYFAGFLLQVVLAGYFIHMLAPSSFWKKATLLALSSAIPLLFGTLWLSLFMPFTLAFSVGFLPFICIEIGKASLAATFAKV